MRLLKVIGAAVVLGTVCVVTVTSTFAEDAAKLIDPDAPTGDKAMDELLAKEKEARKACKIEICSILRGKTIEGPDVDCQMVQTWPKKTLDEIFGRAHISWPWSHMHCRTEVKLKRATLVSAMTSPKYEAGFDSQTMTCELERGQGTDNFSFKVSLAPKVTFENGKATMIQLQWGDIEAPLVAKTVLWSITGLDNKTGLLSSQFVGMTNQFVETKCDQVRDELRLN